MNEKSVIGEERMNRREVSEQKLEYNRLSSRFGAYALICMFSFIGCLLCICPNSETQSGLYNWSLEEPTLYIVLCVALMISCIGSQLWAYHYHILRQEFYYDLIVFCPNCNCKFDFTKHHSSLAYCAYCGTNIWDEQERKE